MGENVLKTVSGAIGGHTKEGARAALEREDALQRLNDALGLENPWAEKDTSFLAKVLTEGIFIPGLFW